MTSRVLSRPPASAGIDIDALPPALLNGVWVLIEGQLGGVRLPLEALALLTLQIENGRFRLGTDCGIVSLSGGLTAGKLDLVATSGPNSGRVVPAIFERAGGMLRICFDLSGVSRPRGFNALPGTRCFLATYRRAAPTPRVAAI